jgi:hypothetical protein
VWAVEDTGLTALGGATMLVGAGLLIYGVHLAGDHGGTLSDYNDRLSLASGTQWGGVACLTAGALAIGGAVLHWRLHLVDGEIQPVATAKAAGITWAGRW